MTPTVHIIDPALDACQPSRPYTINGCLKSDRLCVLVSADDLRGSEPIRRLTCVPTAVQLLLAPNLAEVGATAERIRDLSIAAVGIEGGEAIELAFVEAANNVIQHGGISPDSWLEISFHSDTAGVTLELRDQGRPLPKDALDSAGEPGDALAVSSRGLWLIRTLMDNVSYSSSSDVNKLVLFRGC
jgi:anti-sigma regulatory factor (Ser/Thr protein kinase)